MRCLWSERQFDALDGCPWGPVARDSIGAFSVDRSAIAPAGTFGGTQWNQRCIEYWRQFVGSFAQSSCVFPFSSSRAALRPVAITRTAAGARAAGDQREPAPVAGPPEVAAASWERAASKHRAEPPEPAPVESARVESAPVAREPVVAPLAAPVDEGPRREAREPADAVVVASAETAIGVRAGVAAEEAPREEWAERERAASGQAAPAAGSASPATPAVRAPSGAETTAVTAAIGATPPSPHPCASVAGVRPARGLPAVTRWRDRPAAAETFAVIQAHQWAAPCPVGR